VKNMSGTVHAWMLGFFVAVTCYCCKQRDRNALDVSVSNAESGHPVFRLRLPWPDSRPPAVNSIRVEYLPSGELVCMIWCGDTSYRTSKWSYGQELPGCDSRRCSALSPGHYRMGVSASGCLGVVEFSVSQRQESGQDVPGQSQSPHRR
jgi:hypothetical protein